ncbi:MAG: ABC transporter permease [Ruminococcus sp.]|nr:ABC transporter permease [Ruminococcus sp.]
MSRFFRLVKNEYIKLLKKVSTKLLIVLVILGSIGVVGIYKAIVEFSDNDYYYQGSNEVDYTSDIEWYNSTKPDGYERIVELYTYLDTLELDYVEDEDIMQMVWLIEQSELTAAQAENILDPWVNGGDWKASFEAAAEYTDNEARIWELDYRIENDIAYNGSWQDELVTEIMYAKENLEAYVGTDSQSEYEDEITLGLYRLENNIAVNAADAADEDALYDTVDLSIMWYSLVNPSIFITLVGLVVMVAAGSIVANEYSTGTVKFLLVNPVKRWKILLSKYFTIISFGYILTLVSFVIVVLTSGIVTGFSEFGASYLEVVDGGVVSSSAYSHAAVEWLVGSIEFVAMGTFAMAISALSKNSALSVGLSIFLTLSGYTLVAMLNSLGFDWARYILFANLDLTSIASGNSSFAQHSLGFAITVIAAHMVVFLLTMFDAFDKKEI